MNQIPSPYKEKLEERASERAAAATISLRDKFDLAKIYSAFGSIDLWNLLLEGSDEFDRDAFLKAADAIGLTRSTSHIMAERMARWQHQLSQAKYQAKIAELEAKVKDLELTVKTRDAIIQGQAEALNEV